LTESRLSDVLTVSLDHTGSVIAVSMSTSPAICEGRHIDHNDLQHFNTTVFVKHMEQGPTYVLLVLSYFLVHAFGKKVKFSIRCAVIGGLVDLMEVW
jgi:hypothetical protein